MADARTDLLGKRPLGPTGLEVTGICVGAAPLGSMPADYGEVGAEQGIAVARRALAGPFNFLDTANNYGDGRSERRIGVALRDAGGVPDGFVLATKVDRDASGDFSGARVRRSLEESFHRLGISRAQLVYLHDPEHISFAQGVASGGPVEALVALRDEGLIEHLGVAGGPIDLLLEYLDTGVFEVVLTHNRFTLVDRTADPLLDAAAARGLAAVNGAPFGGGVLAKGPEARPTYAYEPLTTEARRRIAALAATCDRHDVGVAAVALQHSLRDPRIASTVVGVSGPERIDELDRLARVPVPAELWEALEAEG
jgi:D-threo-aldose 1-dehydrogenase